MTQFVSDDFSGGALTQGWSLQGPAGNYQLGTAGGEAYLELVVPQGDFNLWGNNRAVRMMQAAVD